MNKVSNIAEVGSKSCGVDLNEINKIEKNVSNEYHVHDRIHEYIRKH